MKIYSDDGYAAMLLTMALSPDREEYARPFSVQEFRALESATRNSDLKHIGRLLNMDISGLMIHLGMTEEMAYRAFTLLQRLVQLTYALEAFDREGIEVVTCYDAEYPVRIRRKMGENAPAFFYICGNEALLTQKAVAIVGIRGVRTDADVREMLEELVQSAVKRGYAIITGGELGVCRAAAMLTLKYGGQLMDVLGGGMQEHIHEEGVAELIGMGAGAALSMVHPQTVFTVSHAIARNKLLFSMADAAFIFNTDGRRGENDILQNRLCDWVYAWEGSARNLPLISKGAMPLNRGMLADFDALSSHWSSSSAEQLSIFDLFG